ncbi:nucleotide exchange factor GrpE [Rhodoplanes serenus]|uniref:nucleotide exchange factor GrpE n=1 Tax=Rhodoplanes serenus TaxID=200615 RepID=UPI000DAC211F|nr:nucleotide exchange factor GrpE [Rhodoplanes serenus]RAI34099.1 nucleotide exchange factor GrpE [Rhodoplanes serenus]
MTEPNAGDAAPATEAARASQPADPAKAAAAAPATGAAAAEPTEGAATSPATPAVDVAALQQEVADSKDRLLRTLAEMENLRRRTEREVADARAYGISGFARDLLGVADNLRRALDAVAAETRDALPAPVLAFVEGVELTERELLKVFERNGVRRFDPKGEKFDPNVHQAMFEVPDPSQPTGTVVQVVQAGFMIGERVLRPAMVGVSKGGPKAAPAGSPAAAANGAPGTGTASNDAATPGDKPGA